MRNERRVLRISVGLLVAAALSSSLPPPALAHHGVANFDLNTEIEITGKVTEISLVNPHSWLYLEVTTPDGKVTPWKCELRGASVLRRSGWTREMFSPGTVITISGSPDRFEANTCYFGTAVFGNGTRIDRYGQIQRPAPQLAERPARLPSGRPNLSGDWAAEQRMLTDPRGMSGAFLPMSTARKLEPGAVPEGAQPFPGTRGTEVANAEDPISAFWQRPSPLPLTEAGARAIEGFDGASSDNPRLRCETTNILFDWTFESDVNRIVQEDDVIRMTYGSYGLERVIYLNMTEHPANITPTRAGHSIGRWEDDVLVVDTVGFAPGILLADGRVPHSEQLRVVERFTLDAERRALVRQFVATDPKYFSGEYTGSDTVYVADVPFQVEPCDDRSYKSDAGPGGSRPWMLWSAAGILGVLLLWTARTITRSRRRHA